MAEVKYRITGKDNSKAAVKSATKGMQTMEKAAKTMGTVMKAAFAVIGIQKFTQAISNCTKAFQEQEQVERRLAAAAKNNPYLNQKSVTSLENYASALQSVSTFGDEAIIQQQSFLASLNLQEKQINDVMTAAVDLASTGMVSLESAVKNISKTYGGMTGELGELIPALKDLSTEELKAGKAVDFIKRQYAGMAVAARSSVEGTKTAIKGLASDMMEEIGKPFALMQKQMLEKLKPVFERVTKWFTDNGPKIYAIFTNIVPIIKMTFDLVITIIKNAFSSDNYINTLTRFGSAINAAISASLQTVPEMFMGLMDTLRDIVLQVGPVLGKMFFKSVFTIEDAGLAAKMGKGLKKIFGTDFGFSTGNSMFGIGEGSTNEQLLADLDIGMREVKYRAEMRAKKLKDSVGGKITEAINAYGGAVRETINLSAKEIEKYVTDLNALLAAGQVTFEEWNAKIDEIPGMSGSGTGGTGGTDSTISDDVAIIANLFPSMYSQMKQSAIDDIKYTQEAQRAYDRVNEELKKAVENDNVKQIDILGAMREELEGILGIVDKIEENIEKVMPGGYNLDAMYNQSGSSRSGRANPMAGIIQGDLIPSKFMQILEVVGGRFMDLLGALGPVVQLMDPLGIILQAVFDTIGPLITEVLKPVIGFLSILGQTIGKLLVPIIQALSPVIEYLLLKFIKLYNFLTPLLNIIYKFFLTVKVVITSIVAAVRNIGIAIYNLVHKKSKRKEYIPMPGEPDLTKDYFEKIDMDDLYAAGDQNANGGGAGASYTSGRNVTVNVDIKTDVIVGDRREMAIWIAEEIKEAEDLGLIA